MLHLQIIFSHGNIIDRDVRAAIRASYRTLIIGIYTPHEGIIDTLYEKGRAFGTSIENIFLFLLAIVVNNCFLGHVSGSKTIGVAIHIISTHIKRVLPISVVMGDDFDNLKVKVFCIETQCSCIRNSDL